MKRPALAAILRPSGRPALLTGFLLALGGCASDPPQLVALPVTAPVAQVVADPASLLLRPVKIPGYLDNLNVVTSRQGGAVAIARDTEWAERLGDGTTRVLADALSSRLGPGNLLIEGDGRIPDADLSVEITRMDPDAGRLRLEARWTMVGSRGAQRPVRAGNEVIEVSLPGSTPAAVADATSQALGQLADRLAAAAATFPERQRGF